MHLIADKVSFGYGRDAEILHNVSLRARSGLLIGILGPNGSGKTTLLRLLTGAERPQSGSVLLDGTPISALRPRLLAQRMALVPQRAATSSDFTALDVVLMGRQPHLGRFQSESASDIAAARAAMERLGILELAERRVTGLSGGEWQRVTIARALCQEAEILLLDEPVSSLDIRHQIETLRLLRSLAHERGVACVCVLHDVNLAAHFCDELTVLYGGRVFASGRPGQVVTPELLRAVYGIGAAVEVDESGLPRIAPFYE